MTVDEIFKKISERKILGVMTHDYMVDYFHFLNLDGYKKMQEYHAEHEMKDFRHLHTFYINHYSKLVPDMEFERIDIIPSSWYEHVRSDVDTNTKRSAVKDAFIKWKEWEKETKKVYEQAYKELFDMGEILASVEVMKLIEDVNDEIKWVCKYCMDLANMDYSMSFIIGEQERFKKLYKDKLYK